DDEVLSWVSSVINVLAFASSFGCLASPCSLEAVFRRACACSNLVIAARRFRSSAMSFLDRGCNPRRFSPRSKEPGCSQIHLMSYMAGFLSRSRQEIEVKCGHLVDHVGPRRCASLPWGRMAQATTPGFPVPAVP